MGGGGGTGKIVAIAVSIKCKGLISLALFASFLVILTRVNQFLSHFTRKGSIDHSKCQLNNPLLVR